MIRLRAHEFAWLVIAVLLGTAVRFVWLAS